MAEEDLRGLLSRQHSRIDALEKARQAPEEELIEIDSVPANLTFTVDGLLILFFGSSL